MNKRLCLTAALSALAGNAMRAAWGGRLGFRFRIRLMDGEFMADLVVTNS